MRNLSIKNIWPNGDCAVLIRFADSKDSNPEIRLAGIHALATELLTTSIDSIADNLINVIPSTDSLVMVFNQPVQPDDTLLEVLKSVVKNLDIDENKVKAHEIPVCYDASLSPDLIAACKSLKLSKEQLVEYHTGPSYQVEMLGFLPGFAYLSANHKVLNLARKASPSLQVPAGSIAIAGLQTGIYSLASPGGWHVIGRTPMQLLDFNNSGQQPMALNPLDQVQFKSISLKQYNNFRTDDQYVVQEND